MKINERQLRQIIREALLESVYNGFDLRKLQNHFSYAQREGGDGDVRTGSFRIGNASDRAESSEYDSEYDGNLSWMWSSLIQFSCKRVFPREIAWKMIDRLEDALTSDEEVEEFIGVLEKGDFEAGAELIDRVGKQNLDWINGYKAKYGENSIFSPRDTDYDFEVTPEMLRTFYKGFVEEYNEMNQQIDQ
jgi:hypothetical protein